MEKSKILIILLLISITANAQFDRFGLGKSEHFNFSVSIDPMGSLDTESPNLTAEIELEEHWFYIKGGSQINPGLEGGYIDLAGAVGLNFTTGLFETFRYYAGFRGGGIIRDGVVHPLFGYEAGINWNITDTFFIGLRGTYDYRSDWEFWGTDPDYLFNGSVRIGCRF